MLENESSISYMAEFKDRDIEKKYIDYDIKNSIEYIKQIILILGILYFVFIIPDYFFIKNINNFMIVLLNRSAILFTAVLIWYRLNKLKSYIYYCGLITIYEIIIIFSYMITFFLYQSPDFMIQSFGITIIILGFYMIPNRWIFLLISSVMAGVIFFVAAVIVIKSIDRSELLASIMFTLLVLTFVSVSSFRRNSYKRINFENNKELFKISNTDKLTGTYNRTCFDREIANILRQAKVFNSRVSLIIFDFDDFKKVNDIYGHLVGDKVLYSVVNVVKKLIREDDLLFRWGGEEFVIILSNTGNREAFDIAERLRLEISKQNIWPIEGKITCSFGVTLLTEEDDVTSFVGRADQLLYQAKKSGKNKVVQMC